MISSSAENSTPSILQQTGTKAAAHYVFNLAPKAQETIYLRF